MKALEAWPSQARHGHSRAATALSSRQPHYVQVSKCSIPGSCHHAARPSYVPVTPTDQRVCQLKQTRGQVHLLLLERAYRALGWRLRQQVWYGRAFEHDNLSRNKGAFVTCAAVPWCTQHLSQIYPLTVSTSSLVDVHSFTNMTHVAERVTAVHSDWAHSRSALFGSTVAPCGEAPGLWGFFTR